MNRLEVCLAFQRGSDSSGIDLAVEWSQILKCPLSLFENQATSCTDDKFHVYESLATYDLDLSPNIDKYLSSMTNIKTWSPWGTKSGPNYQFFQIIDHYRSHRRADWVLFLEADTFCTSQLARTHIERLLENHSDAWVIGASPHPKTRARLMPDLWDHINGACLLHVGDSDFQDFASRVWIPSVIDRIRTLPYYAYDCITATREWAKLPDSLESEWIKNANKFIRTSTMINTSSIRLSLRDIQTLTNAGSIDSQTRAGSSIWFAHAKIREYLDAKSPAERLRILQVLLTD